MSQVANVPSRRGLAGATAQQNVPLTWSVQGNLLTDGRGNSFVHDALNRLTKVTKSDGSQIYHRYDPMGIRIESVRTPTGLDAAGDPTGGDRTRYLTAKTEEIADLDQNRNIIRIYIPGAKRVWRECAKLRDQRKLIDERVAQIEANGAISYIHTDHQSSVIAITDSAGHPVSRRKYGVYGETNSDQMSGASAGANASGAASLRPFYGFESAPALSICFANHLRSHLATQGAGMMLTQASIITEPDGMTLS